MYLVKVAKSSRGGKSDQEIRILLPLSQDADPAGRKDGFVGL
jgi:hypothetical protein